MPSLFKWFRRKPAKNQKGVSGRSEQKRQDNTQPQPSQHSKEKKEQTAKPGTTSLVLPISDKQPPSQALQKMASASEKKIAETKKITITKLPTFKELSSLLQKPLYELTMLSVKQGCVLNSFDAPLDEKTLKQLIQPFSSRIQLNLKPLPTSTAKKDQADDLKSTAVNGTTDPLKRELLNWILDGYKTRYLQASSTRTLLNRLVTLVKDHPEVRHQLKEHHPKTYQWLMQLTEGFLKATFLNSYELLIYILNNDRILKLNDDIVPLLVQTLREEQRQHFKDYYASSFEVLSRCICTGASQTFFALTSLLTPEDWQQLMNGKTNSAMKEKAPEKTTSEKKSLLLLAVEHKQTTIVKSLLKKDFLLQDEDLKEALQLALKAEDVDTMEALLKKLDKVSFVKELLNMAIEEGYQNSAVYLLKWFNTPQTKVDAVKKVLKFLFKEGNEALAASVLQKYKDLLQRYKQVTNNLLMEAVREGNIVMVNRLVEKGFVEKSVIRRGSFLLEALKTAKEDTKAAFMTALLLHYGANPNGSVTEEKATALHYAAQKGFIEAMQLLLYEDADVRAKTKDGLTPLHWTTFEDRGEAARLLIKHGAEVEDKDAEGKTPLHYAAMKDAKKVAEVLFSHGAIAEAVDQQGRTPLHYAAMYGATQVAQQLLNHGASLQKKDHHGKTPWQLAKENLNSSHPLVRLFHHSQPKA